MVSLPESVAVVVRTDGSLALAVDDGDVGDDLHAVGTHHLFAVCCCAA